MDGTASGSRFPWYELVAGSDLQQGDLLAGCPMVRPTYGSLAEAQAVDVVVTTRAGIVLTQSCDLVVRDDGRCHSEEVLLGSVYSIAELISHHVFGRPTGWEEARKGRHPSYHVLNRCDLPGYERDFMLVDFSRVFTLETALARELAVAQGQRLRLLPPYREHLSQAFARFFMRVGLPVDIPPFR